MAFNGNFMCTSFKEGLLNGDFDFSSGTSHVFKIALFTSSADGTDFGGTSTDMDATVKYYATNNETTGSGYSAGGGVLSISTNPTSTGTTAFIDFDDETFSNASITARGAIIYRSDVSAPTNDAVCVLDFGSDKTSTTGDFTIVFPTGDSSNAIIRIA